MSETIICSECGNPIDKHKMDCNRPEEKPKDRPRMCGCGFIHYSYERCGPW